MPAGGSDTTTLPRRSFKGSEETPVAEEERVPIAKGLEIVKEIRPEYFLKVKKPKMKSVGGPSRMVTVGEHVGTSASSSKKRIRILKENSRVAHKKLKRAHRKFIDAFEKLNAVTLKRDEASFRKEAVHTLYRQLIKEYESAANNAIEFFKNYKLYQDLAKDALHRIIFITKTQDQLRAYADTINPSINAANDAANMGKLHSHYVRSETLLNEANNAGEDIKNVESFYKDATNLADSYSELFRKADQDLKNQLPLVEFYKTSANAVSHSLNLLDGEVQQAEEAFSRAQANQNYRVAKALHADKKLKDAQARRNT
ncbi:uncharacterized protein PHALS_07661 [Plasmopara halstedii]|uniref:Uncharacterized protein n=1 Tax=Plasmopara halstedii TaxID=4781 RepID=A0A0P1B6D1_PLAHL|nr:uncharacterized protein PHALS_07661 [Plasmopara halstedii]CEG49925.1 hypothetical protein PHALS_07661 [Plasmopara halstedii]|eukprot:XP_024586294.1 hypothetical protein PHALS_07661 [Plasmopara halstedii]